MTPLTQNSLLSKCGPGCALTILKSWFDKHGKYTIAMFLSYLCFTFEKVPFFPLPCMLCDTLHGVELQALSELTKAQRMSSTINI